MRKPFGRKAALTRPAFRVPGGRMRPQRGCARAEFRYPRSNTTRRLHEHQGHSDHLRRLDLRCLRAHAVAGRAGRDVCPRRARGTRSASCARPAPSTRAGSARAMAPGRPPSVSSGDGRCSAASDAAASVGTSSRRAPSHARRRAVRGHLGGPRRRLPAPAPVIGPRDSAGAACRIREPRHVRAVPTNGEHRSPPRSRRSTRPSTAARSPGLPGRSVLRASA